MITVKEVNGGKGLKEFIDLPYRLYRDDAYYVPELRLMQRETLNKKKNKFFRHGDAAYFIARDGRGKTLGRIAAITNDNYEKHHGEKIGFFGFFESIDDREVAHTLFDRVKQWLKDKGVKGIHGPMNPSTNDTCGTLIEGFDRPPYVMMVHNPPYYDKLIAGEGFEKAMDLYSYRLDRKEFNPRFISLTSRVEERLKKSGIVIRQANFKDLEGESKKLRSIYNAAWADNWGFVPMDEDEFSDLVKELKMVTRSDLVYIAEDRGKAVAFIALLPDLNQRLIQIPNGRLLPFNFMKLIGFQKKVNKVRVLTLGIIPGYRHTGIDAVMYAKCYEATGKYGYTEAEASWILENNDMMNRILRNTNAKVYKKYRIYAYRY